MATHVEAGAHVVAEALEGELLAELRRDRVELELDLAKRADHLQVWPDRRGLGLLGLGLGLGFGFGFGFGFGLA